MKILFICGCLEPGRDGVGDYVRKLGGKLIKNGQEIGIISLNDHFVSKDFFKEEIQDQIPVVRIRVGNTRTQILSQVQKRIKELDPEWLSLQFVPFSFHNKGLPWRLAKQLSFLGNGRKWHIMFHELWLGGAKSDSIKYKILGSIQKRLVMMLLDKIKPVEVFTNNNFYKNLLITIGVTAKIVPVFSNIPLGNPKTSLLFGNLPENIIKCRNKYLIASFFGNVEFSDELESNLIKLKRLTQKENKELFVSHIGISKGVAEKFKEWDSRLGIKTFLFGIQEELSIADYFRKIDVGLSTYPKILVQKSGSIAAMNHNKLPVILLKKSFVEDQCSLDWVKDITEISNLNNFILSVKQDKSHFSIERSIEAYSTFN